MNVKVVVFDMDDTLYDESNFVKSGFKIVSQHFSQKYNLNNESYYNKMLDILENQGRGKVFDDVLRKYNIYSKTNVKKSISLYRMHKPDINLSENSIEILNYLNKKKIPLYLVTDGNKIVQQNKATALNLDSYFKKIFITHRYGIINAKPSTYCFEKIAKLEKIPFDKIVYIGDNVNKDFINIKKLGFETIMLKQGMFKDVVKSEEYQAKYEIYSILELKGYISSKV